MAELTAGDRYRVRYEPGRSVWGALLARMFFFGRTMPYGRASLPSRASEEAAKPESVQRFEDSARVKKSRSVLIEAPDGSVVWAKPVDNRQQAEDLIELIHQQVFPAALADFEAWLLTQDASR